VWADNFAYGSGFDEAKGKYLGLQVATGINPSISPYSLLVKPEVAKKQLDAEAAQANPKTTIETTGDSISLNGSSDSARKDGEQNRAAVTQVAVPRRFYGNVDIDAMRINRDAPAIANEVIQHLTALNGATVKITLEIEAEIPEGVPDDVARTIMENCRTLKFNSQSFEQT
jgi:hypothetical protein